ncbi:hypothetical protein E8E95_00600 [Pseudomonas sp. BN414]|uniref:hypothetical protein n=1 Tax=Pseudomonas sp. BN414 TaxID=2567888 RepID=UPI0024575228|nr:hypothetical protein [Pseudomonas sp. BN414]MDH4565184.1 hypothetical protein [Pseudomonas sp. BN414]
MQAVLTVLINPVQNRDDDFNDWYTNVHIRDVMRFAGSIRVQRLVASPVQIEEPPHRYFTLYDTFDPVLLSREHRDAMGTRRMVVTHAHDKANVINGYYYPVASRTLQPTHLTSDDQPLILEQLNVPESQRAAFEDWYASVRLPDLLRTDGHVSGTLLRFEQYGQMFKFDPAFSHVALWRVEDLRSALEAWRHVPDRLELNSRRVSCFDPMGPYLTRDHVLNASQDALAIEEAARQRAEKSSATTEQLGITWN